MTRRLVLSYLGITVFVLLVLTIPLGVTFATRQRNRLFTDIERDARVFATLYEDYLERGAGEIDQTNATAYATRTNSRIVVVDTQGLSVLDTSADTSIGRDFSTRPEMALALTGKLATGERASDTLGANFVYVAVPVGSSGHVYGAVRITYPLSTLEHRIRENWIRLGLLCAVVIAAVLAVGWVLARSVTRPVRKLEEASANIADGDFSTRVEPDGPPELRTLASSFNTMTERVEQLVQREKAFSADASHQLRTPLTALRLRLESLEYSVDDEGRDDLDAALRETQRLSHVVDVLLTLARTEAGATPLLDVDLATVARDRRDMWTPLAEERDVHVVYDGPATAPALAIANAVDQILDNLLSNALDVAPEGSTVTIAVTSTPNTATITVIDEGPGMSDEQLARAFDRFWTTSGTGLGLAIVRQLAQASRGSARAVRAGDDHGLEVGVTFRRVR